MHSGEDFFGDIGGYCDLFLGLSVLRFVFLVKDKLKAAVRKRTDRSEAELDCEKEAAEDGKVRKTDVSVISSWRLPNLLPTRR